MVMNLANAYTLSQDLSESTEKLQSHQTDLKGIKTSQTIFTVATYFIYFSFTSVIFAGVPVWHLQDYIFANSTNVIGLTWALVTVFSVPLALSLAKHFNYQAIAKSSLERQKQRSLVIVHSVILLALISGLYYEAISASSNLQAKAFHAVENSKAGESILNTTVTSSSTGAIAGLIADAEFKLVTCQRLVKEGKLKDCDNSTAKLNSLKAQAQAERDSVASANVAAITAKQEALSKERAEHALPAAKYAAELVDMSNDAGTMIIVIIAALFFELIHLTTIFNEARALRGIDHETVSLKGLNGEYFRATGKTFDVGDFKDNRTIDLSDKPLNVPLDDQGADFEIRTKGQPYKDNRDGFGFIPKTAKLFKWQEETPVPEKPGFGFIPTRSRKSKEAAQGEANPAKYPQEILFPTGKGKTADDYALIPREDFKCTDEPETADTTDTTDTTVSTQNAPAHTYRDALRNGSREYRDTALDAITTPPPEKPCVEPAEQQAEKPRVEPRARGLEKADENHVHVVSDAPTAHSTTETLYPAWVAAVGAGECRASVNESRAWIQKHIAPVMTGSKTNDLKRIDQMRKGFFSRAIREGLMQLNPAYRNGGKKYIWIG